MSHPKFVAAMDALKEFRSKIARIQTIKGQFELLVRFDEETMLLWGLYQQALLGDIRVPKRNYTDPAEQSVMWGWTNGNKRWHAWNECRGLSREEATAAFIDGVAQLLGKIDGLIEEWRDDQDPRVPDRKAVENAADKREERREGRVKAVEERRIRDGWMKTALGV
ncbi:acbp-7 [Pristionchus pacificus]|uniref:Acbp-7 n=1 Tax=Pristionchus pacificus TaxID=54126 RepID=A0A2A6BPR5_PRIPA|nr:acbp-7 [Pristionchus pacificus]|eukprot:PDM67895.1 acbp-7 [Pristionchus pacificus]